MRGEVRIDSEAVQDYRLRYSPRVINYFTRKLKEFGLDQFRGEPCTFRERDKCNPRKVKMMLRVHVDDIIVTSSDADCDALVRFLSDTLPISDLGELTYYTGGVLEGDEDRGR